MFRDEALLNRSKHGQFKVIHNHLASNNPTPPVFNTTKRLPGTTEFVSKIRPKGKVKA
jgi:hypothetical protein